MPPAKSLLLALIAFMAFMPTRSQADLLDLLAGDTINASIARIDTILAKYVDRLDERGRWYVGELDKIVLRTASSAQDLREDLKRDVFELERRVFDDVSGAIWEAECAAVRVTGTFREDVVTAVDTVLRDAPRAELRVATIPLAELRLSVEENTTTPTPDIVYYQYRQGALDLLERRLEEDREAASAYGIYSTFNSIAVLARQTACRFPGLTAEQRFLREHIRFAALATPWDRAVSVQPMSALPAPDP